MSSPQKKMGNFALYLRRQGYDLGLIAVVAWLAHYLHFTKFGLYEDDWYYVGFPFLVTLKDWMVVSLYGQYKNLHFQGRPLQVLFEYTFAELGALTKSLAVDYLIAYVLFAASALLLYVVLRRRFSRFISILSAIIFVLTPLHTLHQFLGQYSVAPALIMMFAAILLYLDGRRIWSYFLAVLSLFCYESVFFLFLGAPLIRKDSFRGRRREWLIHLGVCVIAAAGYLLARKVFGESRVSGLPIGFSLIRPVLYAAVFNSVTSFATYLYAALRAHEAGIEGLVYSVVFLLLIGRIFYTYERQRANPGGRIQRGIRDLLSPAVVGLVFLFLGYAASYFFFREDPPHFHVTDRDTRVSMAASVGSSIFVAACLAGWVAIFRSRTGRIAAYVGTASFLTVLFLYSFVLQQDYVDDWQEQRSEAAQIMTLTPDVDPDSLIVLQLHVPGLPFFTQGRRRRAIGLEKTLFEWEFQNLYALGKPWPRLFIVYSDAWTHHLKPDPEGLMSWDAPVFDGRWYPSSGDSRARAGRFIVLDEVEPGWIVRRSDPVMISGQQIVQQAPTAVDRAPLWASLRQTALTRLFLPDSSWKSVLPQSVALGSNTPLTNPVVTFTWPPDKAAVDYWVDVGTAPAKGNIAAGFTRGKAEFAVNLSGHLTGETIYVQLYPKLPSKDIAVGTGLKYSFPTSENLK